MSNATHLDIHCKLFFTRLTICMMHGHVLHTFNICVFYLFVRNLSNKRNHPYFAKYLFSTLSCRCWSGIPPVRNESWTHTQTLTTHSRTLTLHLARASCHLSQQRYKLLKRNRPNISLCFLYSLLSSLSPRRPRITNYALHLHVLNEWRGMSWKCGILPRGREVGMANPHSLPL